MAIRSHRMLQGRDRMHAAPRRRPVLAFCLVLAGALLAFPSPGQDDDSTELETMVVEPPHTDQSDRALARLRKKHGCTDCVEVDHGEIPRYLKIPLNFGAAIVRQFLPQPRVRGEPMDEALYYSLQDCIPDEITCRGAHPNRALVNWAPDDNQTLQDDPNAYAR